VVVPIRGQVEVIPALLGLRRPRLIVSPVLIVTALLTACGGDGGGGDIVEPPPQPAPVASVTVTAPATTIQVGETVQLVATAYDALGATLENRAFGWSPSDPTVASVSTSGLVTAIAPGEVQINATSEGVTGTIAITITPGTLPPPPPPPAGPPGLQEIASGLRFPLYLTSPPGDERLFVVQKGGVIRVIKDGALLDGPFLDITPKVLSTGGEQGLLGLAFFPDYATTGRFLVHYTDQSGTSQISMFRVSADPDVADPAESVVLPVPRPGHAHNGGQILFGPDGYLYIGLGDGADNDGGRGQSLEDLLASILRIDVSSAPAYTVPADNPFVATAGARPEVWSYGLRNPWRFTFDRATGDLYIGDVGESKWEEVNYSSAAEGAGRGVNYGWSQMEGRHCMRASGCSEELTLPIVEYSHSEGCSVTGGYVYRGAALPQLQGRYFYADYCGGWVRSLRMEGGAPVEETEWPELSPTGLVTSFGEDTAGELYLTTQEGKIYKIVPR
jgi:glucose/arabinose dehydrogenase